MKLWPIKKINIDLKKSLKILFQKQSEWMQLERSRMVYLYGTEVLSPLLIIRSAYEGQTLKSADFISPI